MPSKQLLITPRDPVIARDGRPFQFGQRVRSLDWIYPSVLIGSLRTLLGKQLGWDFNKEQIELLKQIELTGLFPFCNDKLFFSKPSDYIVNENKGKVYALRPAELRDGEGSNLPNGLLPAMLPDKADDFKPKKTAAFWSAEKMLRWLALETANDLPFQDEEKDKNVLQSPQQDERAHVKIEVNSGASEKSMLFSTTGLDFNETKIAASVNAPDQFQETINKLNVLHPLGGERRLVHWESKQDSMFPPVPKGIKGTKYLRLVLVTPAIFSNGYQPGWIDKSTLIGILPDCNVKVKLVGAIVDRWRPLSGWSYETGKKGPKPVRRLVPAGSVYFFETLEGTLQDVLDKCWLKSVCDHPQDRNDGFGLSLWGVWNKNN
jgi:CRISPR-associated protein Cmr3